MTLDLTSTEHAHLSAIVRAGAAGLRIEGREVVLSICARLEGLELATIVIGDHVRAYATARGCAFQQRTAA